MQSVVGRRALANFLKRDLPFIDGMIKTGLLPQPDKTSGRPVWNLSTNQIAECFMDSHGRRMTSDDVARAAEDDERDPGVLDGAIAAAEAKVQAAYSAAQQTPNRNAIDAYSKAKREHQALLVKQGGK